MIKQKFKCKIIVADVTFGCGAVIPMVYSYDDKMNRFAAHLFFVDSLFPKHSDVTILRSIKWNKTKWNRAIYKRFKDAGRIDIKSIKYRIVRVNSKNDPFKGKYRWKDYWARYHEYAITGRKKNWDGYTILIKSEV